MTTQEKVIEMKKEIVRAAIKYGLNLTIHDGKIGFVDQRHKKIVALWSPEYTLSSGDNNTCVCCGITIPEGRYICPPCENDRVAQNIRTVANSKAIEKFVLQDGTQPTIDDVEENNQ
jgi:hypothetical protein